MLAVFNASGDLLTLTPSQVNQGSNKANTIYIVMPLAPTNVLQARFRLPNGKFTTPVAVPVAPETGYLGFTDQDGNQLYMWSYTIPSALTAYAGTVLAQFTATNEELVINNEQVTEERVLATFSFEFEVLEGVPPIDVGTINSYQSVIEALQSINIAITNNDNTLQAEINQLENTKQNKTDSALQTESKQVVGAINELNIVLKQLKETGAGTTVTVDGESVNVFNADTKLDVTAFEEYEAKIDAILDQSEILTIEEITSQYNEQATGNSRNVLNGSEVNVLAVAGDSKQPENLMPLPYNIASYYPGVSATALGRFISVTTSTPATAPRYIKLCEGEFEKGTYYLYGNLQKSSNAALYVEYDGGVPFRDYGKGVKVELDEDKTLKFYIAFDEGAVAGTYNFFPIFQKDTMGIVSATFAGIKSESKNLTYPFELDPVSSVRDYAEAIINNNIITVNVHTRLDLTSTTNIEYFAVKRGLNLTQGRYIITGSPQSSIDSVCLHIEYYEGGPYKTAEDVGNGVEFTIDRDSTATLYISLGNKTQIGEYVFTPALRKYAPDGTLEDVWSFPKTELPIGTTLNFLSKTKTNTYAEYTFTGDELWAEGKISSNPNYYQAYFNNWIPSLKVDSTVVKQKGVVCDRYPSTTEDVTALTGGIFVKVNSSGSFFVFVPTDLVDASKIGQSYNNLTKGMTIRYPTTPDNTEWYKTENFTSEQVSAGNSYEAYYEGTEQVLGNDAAEAGAKNTITAEYVVVKKVGN